MRSPVVVLGVPVDPVSMTETLDLIQEMVFKGRSTGEIHQVATANVDFIVKAMTDPELRYLLQRADLITADGMPLVWGIRALGVPVKGRVAGSDLVSMLAERAAQTGLSIYFLGGLPGVAAKAAGLLKEKYPALQIAGIHSPPFSPVLKMDTSFLDDIRAARPDILLVALGNPKQEKWIGLHGRSLGVPVMIGIGASLDFIAGYTHRAPGWMQRAGLEWLFRLLQEPRRLFSRYLTDAWVFGPSFFRQWWLMRLASGHTGQSQVADLNILQGLPIVNLHGCLNASNLEAFYQAGQEALKVSPCLLVNMKRASFLDSSAMGILVELGNQAHAAGGELSLAAVPSNILSALAFLKVEKLFPIYPDAGSYLADATSSHNIKSRWNSLIMSSPSSGHSSTILKAPRILDSAISPSFFETGACLLEANPFLICDLSDTTFLTSAGLAALNQLRKIAVQRKGELQVANCSPDAVEAIKKANYEQVLHIYPHISRSAV